MKNSATSNLTESNLVSRMLSEKKFSPDDSEHAILKIDFEGKIIYANQASFASLEEWFSCRKETLPSSFLKQHPGILDPEADFSFSINVKSTVFSFDVIGFKESGYIGLYGFDTINVNEIMIHLAELEKSQSLAN